MNISDALDQYSNICGDVLKRCSAKVSKSFKTVFIETLLLYMVIPRKINFIQLGRYGKHCEQCYRQNFTRKFDWISFNLGFAERLFQVGDRKAIAIDPSYISKSGKHTPWVGYFWSGCAGTMKRGLEIMGIGLLDIDTHNCVSLEGVQSPDTTTLENWGKNLYQWYLKVLEMRKEVLLPVSKYIVADAFFSKLPFVEGLLNMGFQLVSRLRDDANIMYLYQGGKTGRKGRPKTFDGKIDFKNLDLQRMKELDILKEEGKLYTLIVYAKSLKRNIRLVIWVTPKGGHKLYFSTDTHMSGKDTIEFYRTRFQIEFCFRDSKQFTGLYHSQARNIDRMSFAFNASLASVNAAKVMMAENDMPFSMSALKSLIYNSYILKRFFELSGFKPNRTLNAKIVKELIDIAACAA
ncbi:MAG: transposase [Parabacteroides sp.]|nr:transposase [Parabacteroides sp.]